MRRARERNARRQIAIPVVCLRNSTAAGDRELEHYRWQDAVVDRDNQKRGGCRLINKKRP